jgi:hypothetical protein
MSQIAYGAGALARETLDAILRAGTRSFTVLVAALREIFDESAYARFLDRQRATSSPIAYAEFLRESEIAKVRRPRCC